MPIYNNPIIGFRKNDLAKSLPFLKKVMPDKYYGNLKFIETDDTLHNAALLSEQAEF